MHSWRLTHTKSILLIVGTRITHQVTRGSEQLARYQEGIADGFIFGVTGLGRTW